MRDFYVSFDKGNIEVGKGRYPGIKLLQYEDPDPQRINSVMPWSGRGSDSSDAEWEFHRKLGRYYYLAYKNKNFRPFIYPAESSLYFCI